MVTQWALDRLFGNPETVPGRRRDLHRAARRQPRPSARTVAAAGGRAAGRLHRASLAAASAPLVLVLVCGPEGAGALGVLLRVEQRVVRPLVGLGLRLPAGLERGVLLRVLGRVGQRAGRLGRIPGTAQELAAAGAVAAVGVAPVVDAAPARAGGPLAGTGRRAGLFRRHAATSASRFLATPSSSSLNESENFCTPSSSSTRTTSS